MVERHSLLWEIADADGRMLPKNMAAKVPSWRPERSVIYEFRLLGKTRDASVRNKNFANFGGL
jgi:hypothetical protein